MLQLYSEPLQKFRLAAEGHGPIQPPDTHRERIRTYMDPLPIWYPPFEQQQEDSAAYPLHAITQRPPAMYHSWHSQNAWLRQIYSHNRLYMHRRTGAALGIEDDGWVWVISRNGRVKCQVKLMEGVNPDTVWTWNAIGKRSGAWNLSADAPESQKGFLLNHVISEFLPPDANIVRRVNADPVTGQAAWYDLRVRIERADPEPETEPRPRTLRAPPLPRAPRILRYEAEAARMTTLPAPSQKKLGLVIDLDTCVGCHACAVNCKEWNTSGHYAPLTDFDAYQEHPQGVWLNRVHTYEAGTGPDSRTVHFPRSCLHCETPDCVTVCPTGASYKRAEDGIVLVNSDICIGCKLCSWACPYGAREFDEDQGTMKKCTLCIDRIYNENIPETERVPACVSTCPAHARHFGDLGDPTSHVSQLVAERGGFDLMPEMGYKPVNKYLPPRKRQRAETAPEPEQVTPTNALLRWVDRVLSR